ICVGADSAGTAAPCSLPGSSTVCCGSIPSESNGWFPVAKRAERGLPRRQTILAVGSQWEHLSQPFELCEEQMRQGSCGECREQSYQRATEFEPMRRAQEGPRPKKKAHRRS